VKQFNEMSYDELHSHVESAVSALILTAYNLGKMDATAEKIQTPPIPSAHPQDIRDEIIEKAKMDVAELEGEYPGNKFSRIDIIVNKEKRTVVALWKRMGIVVRRGIAKCDPSDCFNIHIGKAIALSRVLGLEVPAEYLNAPQPTKVQVGDVVEYTQWDTNVLVIDNDAEYTDAGETWLESAQYSFSESSNFKILDDSREEVAE
jgi:hypothetical protein